MSGSLKKSLQGHQCANDKARGTAESRAPVFAVEEEQILPPNKKSSCSKFEEACRRRWSLH
jgi:hypothetical protein